jgi:hypothetical protein
MLFRDDHLLHSDDFYAVWRSRDVVGVRIHGPLTDERNPIWRAQVDALCDRDGWPRFVALDVKDAIPAASLPRRVQTALWGKKTLQRITCGSIHLGEDSRVSVTVRAILRVAGMDNVLLRSTDLEFERDVASMLRDESPL